MQEVFEKLIEKIRQNAYMVVQKNNSKELGMTLCGIEQAIQEVSEQYNNGFNDITEKGLPPVGKPLIVTIKDNMQGKPNELRYPVYYEKDSMKGGYHWSWRYGDFAYELIPDVSEVIAWQPLPEAFREKE